MLKPPRYFRWLRRIEWLSVLVAVIVAVSMYANLSLRGQALLDNQTEKLARSLTSLAAFNAANYIESNQQIKLKQLTNALVKENFVFDATIYNHQGVTLAKSDHALPLRELLPMSGNSVTPLQGIGRRPYIATIYNRKGDALGYLRITLEESSLLSRASRYVHSAQLSMQLMLLLALWVGFVTARQLSRKRRRLIKITHRRRSIKAQQRLQKRR
ncbi:AhpA/YtjB family protein [Celerinatantimonas yamalensis]|uniref:AhpA/YtjB family protein n=1 Tax=Celerinatantimonas yamalensis TaxID=559956 RepID=A0ABW9G7R7_9GAMM